MRASTEIPAEKRPYRQFARFALLHFVVAPLLLITSAGAETPVVEISTDYPGASVMVDDNSGPLVTLHPDLKGGRDWFYWNFNAQALRPGVVVFRFPEKVAGFSLGAVGFQGPAFSVDGGKTWAWHGPNETFTSAREFSWKFSKTGEEVRFAVAIPYTETDFAAFAKRHESNPHFHPGVLAKSEKGRDVELVRIGEPGEGRIPMLLTARHHACETMASFLLEGFLERAMADTEEGRVFRGRHVLYVVPFVDKDGVEDGDQGKGRTPHDHNRDYGDEPLYPSVRAIKRLGTEKGIRVLLDFHCPTLVMDIHQRFYFAGSSDMPAGNGEKVRKFADLIKGELPEGAPHGPVLQLEAIDNDRASHCSGYFSKLDGCLFSATLETPFAPKKTKMFPEDLRAYGAAVFRAWGRM